MRYLLIALFVLPLLMGIAASQSGAADDTKCHIGDAALCLSTPGCHWDYSTRGCAAGEGTSGDACAAHEDPNICNANKTFNCGWNDTAKKCETKSG
jgi:hypothetical protein